MRDTALEREVAGQRLRSQKLESVGVLAGGIAHDFNNLLAIILGSVSIASLGMQRGENVLDVLTDAKQACLRAQGLTTQLLTFARGGAPVKKILQLGPVVQEAASLALRGSMVELRLEFASDLHPVEADEGQISQAINNLVINAKQAMTRGGQVTIRLQNATAGEIEGLPLQPGRYTSIRVIDTGSGIAPEYVDRVFDPYFTTKEAGSGLGLASVHSIIQRHGGYVSLQSAPNAGTTFTLYLPAARHRAASHVTTTNLSQAQRAYHVLVLDDDEGVRKVMATTLQYLGHRVVVVGKSDDAFEAFSATAARGDPFNVVFVDLTMPGDLGGAEVARRLQEKKPGIKIVVMSGYSTDPVMARAGELGMVGALQKPFTIDMVCEILSHC
jgi:CheY-like chemotaxis protein